MHNGKPDPASKPRPLRTKKAEGKKAEGQAADAARPTAVVCLGGSAGGLEAIDQFLHHMPALASVAFVVVQHLEAHQKSVIVEMLQRATLMKVLQIEDGMTVQSGHVYLLAPNCELDIRSGVLHARALPTPEPRLTTHLPIDHFLRSLAQDQHARAVAVLLSGMGADGSAGLSAIKEHGGHVLVQSPETAKFGSMPRSALATGLADAQGSAEELPAKLIELLNPDNEGGAENEAAGLSRGPLDIHGTMSGLDLVIKHLRTQTGQDFSLYKKSTLYRRIERRMALHQLHRIGQYVHYLRETPTEADLLFKELLIGVTSFFRDPPVWEQLKASVIPSLLENRLGSGPIRAWTAGCSTGEEAYTLAMILREALDELQPAPHRMIQIFATDLDPAAIDIARQGVYPAEIDHAVSQQRLERFFISEGNTYRVSKEIRDLVIFAPQNLVMDPPFTKLDLLTCRNLLIYLEGDLQKKLMPLFHYSLNPGGVLVLGSSETVGSASDLFAALPGKNRIYNRLNTLPRAELAEFPASRGRTRSDAVASSANPATTALNNLKTSTDAVLLRHYSPAAVLSNDKGDIVYINGRTGQYLEPAAGKATLNLFSMAREGLGGALHEIFAKAVRQGSPATLGGLQAGSGSGSQWVEVTVHPMVDPLSLQGMVLTVFRPQPTLTPTAASELMHGPDQTAEARVTDLGRELKQSREELQTIREEMQTSQEELKSTNEELQSTNEELQSTNEELTTSKEELQSMNEELTTVNHELQSKVDALSQASDDMKNLLNSTDIATLFLDDELRVRRFTTRTTSIIKLIPSDAGRAISDIVTELEYPDMCDDAREVLRSLVFHEQQVASRDGRWFRVRIMPYRTQDKRIDGVVITFVDIGGAKSREVAIRKALALIQSAQEKSQGGQINEVAGLLAEVQEALKQPLTPLENGAHRAQRPRPPAATSL